MRNIHCCSLLISVENREIATQTCQIEDESNGQASATDPQESNDTLTTDETLSPRSMDADSTAHRRSVEGDPQASTCNATPSKDPTERNRTQLSNNDGPDSNLFEKRNFLSSSWMNLQSQAAVRLASYEKMSPQCQRKSMPVWLMTGAN